MTSEPAPARLPVLFSHEPVADLWGRAAGHRVSYGVMSSDGMVTPPGDQAAEVLDEVLDRIARDPQLQGCQVHLPLSRRVLLTGGMPPVRPQDVVLRIHQYDASSPPMMRILERAAERGFRLELDGLTGPDFPTSLLDLFKIVEVDFSTWHVFGIEEALPVIRGRGALALAAGIDSHARREQARSLGCEWFAGPFVAAAARRGLASSAARLGRATAR